MNSNGRKNLDGTKEVRPSIADILIAGPALAALTIYANVEAGMQSSLRRTGYSGNNERNGSYSQDSQVA